VKRLASRHIGILAVALFCIFSWALQAQVNVTTYHNDNARTGQNTQETILTPANVNSSQFGKLFSVTVDGWVYAQPLYLSNVTIGGGTHNVLYVATEHDSLYAIDADSGIIYWQISLIPSGGSTVNSSTDLGCGDLVPEVGITGTPVIDPTTGTIYLVAKSKVNGSLVQYLHAINVATSAEKFSGPVFIQATVPGTASDGNGTTVSFNPHFENQRAGLLLENGHVVIGWSAHCDISPWHGWIMSYSASTLAQEAAFNTSADGSANGVWMSGGGLAADANGNIFFATGNGTWNGTTDYGDSIVKLGPPSGGSFPVLDYFTPYNQSSLAGGDTDVASGGLVLLPNLSSGQQLLTQMGKEGKMYLIDRNNMGKYCVNDVPPCNGSDPNIVQEIPGATAGVWGTPAYWNGSVYWGGGSDGGGPDNLKAFSFNANNSGLISDSPTSESTKQFSFSAPSPTISANGNTNGILWGLDDSAFGSTCSGGSNCQVLYAYDATNLANMLYNSSQAANNRDVPGGAVKFATPIVANGKVYVGSQLKVSAYGATSATPTVTSVNPNNGPAAGGTAITISGTNFVSGATATLGGTAATNVVVVNSTTITATTAAHAAGAVTVTVTNPDTQSGSLTNGFTYTSLPAPTVTGVNPNNGPAAGGTAITISGTNFVSGATATLGGTAATNVVVVNSTTITATTAAHAAGAVTVTVTNPDTQSGSLTNGYTYSGTAPISFAQVSSGPSTIQSSNSSVAVPYGKAQTAGDLNIVAVGWGDSSSTISSVTDSLGNTYSLAVGPTSISNLQQSIYYAKNIAGGSNTVTVTFNQAAAYPDVRILEYSGLDTISPLNVTAAAVGSGTSASSGSANTTAPNELIFGAGTCANEFSGPGSGFTNRIINIYGNIAEDEVVSRIGGYAATAINSGGGWVMQMATFKAAGSLPAPTVTGVNPNNGPAAGGASVTITGTNFVSGATATFGGTGATNVVVVNSTTITATTAAHAAGAVTVTVTNPDTQSGSLTNGYTYLGPAPTVTGVNPNNGPAAGGTPITISGTNFVSGATVTLGGTGATNVVVVNSTTITATTPAHAAGAVTVTVTNPDTQSGSLTNGYTYNPAPTVTGVSPNHGPAAGGTSITISGTNFVTGATVTLGGTAATNVVVVNSTTITATTAAHAAGAVTVTVTNPDTQSGSLTNGYTYLGPAPTVTGVNPNNGPAAGGTPITISGTNFVTGATVTLGGTAATNVVVVNSTTITTKTAAHAAGAVTVTVTNPDTQSGSLTNGYTYTSAISFVQVSSGPSTIQSSNSSVAVPYGKAQTAGDLNIVVVGWGDSSSTISSVTDSLGNTYSLAVGPTSISNLQQSIYYAKNIAGGSNTVTVTFNQAAAYPDVRILEYSGLITISPLDVTAAAVGSGTSASSGSANTTAPNELIFGAGTCANEFSGPGSGFTNRIINIYGNLAEDKMVSSTGNYAATAINSGGGWIMQMATFK